MIKINNIVVMNFDNAIRGARNPMNSWARMDSYYDEEGNYILGDNDLSLASRLAKAGSDHRKFLRQVIVSLDITAPLYWWKEFDTYKVGTVANSCSTMHKIHAKAFEREDFSCRAFTSEFRQGVHIEQTGAFAVGNSVTGRMDVKTDPPVGCGSSCFFGDDPHIGTVGKGRTEIVDIGLEKGFFICRRRKRFSFGTHSDTQLCQKFSIINSRKTEIHN